MKTSLIIALLILMAGCRTQNQSVKELNDEDLVMQVQEHTDKSYRVRLIPETKFLIDKTSDLRNNMWYKMDSCFYIIRGEQKIYPVMQEPVANGISSSFEYLLLFDDAQAPEKGEEIKFIYKDRHISKKSYSLSFNKQF